MRFGLCIIVFINFVCSAQTEMRGGPVETELRGLEWEDDGYDLLPLKLSYFKPPSTTLPASASLKRYCPRVINQSGINMGVAWETVWYARTILQAVASGWQDQATVTRNAFSPGFNYKKCFTGSGCDAPVKLSAVLSSLVWDGALPFSQYPDICPSDTATAELQATARTNRMPGYVRLFNTTDAKALKIRAIKEAIAANHPVVLGIICPPSFSLANEFWQPREDPNKEMGGHALCVVGYNDSAYGGAFEVVNSWGKAWASQGYTWLRYEDIAKFVPYGYELIGAKAPDGNMLMGSVSFTKMDGTPMVAKVRNDGYYQLVKSYPSGTQFQVKIEANTNLFFHAFAFDEKRNHAQLFPPEKGIYSWLSKEEKTLILPDASHSITLTEPAGKNYMLLIFSGREIRNEELIDRLKGGGDFGQVNSGKLSPAKVTWTPDAIAFNSEWTGDALVAVVVEIDQVH